MNSPPSGPPSLAPGVKLDRYELLCPIAEGGMATVWIARRTGRSGFEKVVAIKTILPKFAEDARFQRMFVNEARLASRIEHVNVAQILDVGEQNEMTYLVMEYVDGDALSKIHRALERKGMLIPPGILLRVMADACGGLHAAHELRDANGAFLGVVHRDVSPQNVLLSRTGIAKLIDFGIATVRDRFGGDTNSGQLKGKVRYMAPEHVLGRSLDRRTDVWAVGAILHHLLSGAAPFEGENEMHTILLLKNAPPPPPLPPSVHPAVAEVSRRALSPDPDDRFETAADMQAAIEEAMVEAKLGTTTVMVASFLEEHAADRAQARKDTIALALKAAAERDKYTARLRATTAAKGGLSEDKDADPNSNVPSNSAGAYLAVAPPQAPTGTAQTAAAGRRHRIAILGGVVLGAALAAVALFVLVTRPSSAGLLGKRAAAASAAASAPPPPPPQQSIPPAESEVTRTPAVVRPALQAAAPASATASAAPVIVAQPPVVPARPFQPQRPLVPQGPRKGKTHVDDGF